jgi:hypothetical protein
MTEHKLACPQWPSNDSATSPTESIRLRHVTCVRCGRHVAATQFLRDGRVFDSWGGVFFDSPGFVCDCCLTECRTCRGGNE